MRPDRIPPFLTALALLSLAVLPVAARGAAIHGSVRECRTGAPVKLAAVMILETGAVTMSDSRGRFELVLPSGASVVHVAVSHVSYQEKPPFEVDASGGADVPICLEWRIYEAPAIEVRADRAPPVPSAFDRIELDPALAAVGTFAQTDPLQALKKLPQVSSASDFDGRLSIRGSSPDANAFFLDGLLFPSPYHLGGLCSIYDPANMKSFRFSPVPMTAASHGATAALVEVETKDGLQREEGTTLAVGLLGASLSTQRFAREQTLFASLLARRSYVDLVYDAVSRDENTQIPNFFDVQGSVTLSLDADRYLKLGALLSGDETMMKAGGLAADEGDGATELAWRRRADAVSILYGSRNAEREAWDGRVMLGWQPYASSFSIGGSDDERMEWRGSRGTLRLDLERSLDRGSASAGLFTSISSIAYTLDFGRGFWLASRNENSGVRLDNDGWAFRAKGRDRWAYSGAYGEISRAWGGTSLRGGARLEAFARTGELFASPRISLYRSVSERTTVFASWGVFARDPAEDFGNAEAIGSGIRTEKAEQGTIGLRRDCGAGVLLEGSCYARRERDLPVETEPAVFESGGLGKAYGVELAASRRTGAVTATVSYAFTRAFRMDLPHTLVLGADPADPSHDHLVAAHEAPYWYTSPYERRHALQIEAGARIAGGMSLSIAWRVQSGRPFTPIADVYEREAGGMIATEGVRLSDRLPAYARFDCRAQWQRGRTTAFLEVLNCMNRANVFNLRYDERYARRTYYRMLPLVPAIGVRIAL